MNAIDRRELLKLTGGAVSAAWASRLPASEPAAPEGKPTREEPPTDFQIACMTLPYAQFPLQRALEGIRQAGYRSVAWGTSHRESGGQNVPVMAPDAPPDKARQLAARCRDLGLEPLLMFSTVYPEQEAALQVFPRRIAQAAAAGIPQLLTFGHTEGDHQRVWIERLRQWGKLARDQNVLIVIKQHGGTTGTGAACAKIVREVDDPGVRVNYDAGNVMDYLNLDPLADIASCAPLVRSFCIKDHRDFPRDQDCGPGFGEIDHYRLLAPVAFTGRKLPLCCENIFAPLVEPPQDPAGVDALARRAREFLETVTAGLQAAAK